MTDSNPPRQLRARLARRVRLVRVLRGWSQESLAERCGLHRTYIGAVERGERNLSLDTVERIAVALAVPAALLLEEREPYTWEWQSDGPTEIREGVGLYVPRFRLGPRRISNNLYPDARVPRTDITPGRLFLEIQQRQTHT